jgi:hypothetical protein
MSTAASVLVCALSLLGRSAGTFPPIVLLDVRPAGVSENAEGFVRRQPDTIYLLTSSRTFRDAMLGDVNAVKKIASVIVHEEWHVLHGAAERPAYEAQLTTLWRLNAGPGTRVYHSVTKAMLHVEKAGRQTESAVITVRFLPSDPSDPDQRAQSQ